MPYLQMFFISSFKKPNNEMCKCANSNINYHNGVLEYHKGIIEYLCKDLSLNIAGVYINGLL